MVGNGHPGVRRTRLALHTAVRLHDGEVAHEAELLDISLSGARLRRPAGWCGASAPPLLLEIPDEDGGALRIAARIAREGAQELALDFQRSAGDQDRLLADLLARRGTLQDGLHD